MIILGIDPGTATTGYGLIKVRKKSLKKKKRKAKSDLKKIQPTGYGTIEYGIIDTEPNLSDAARLRILYNQLNLIIKKYKPDFIAVESIYFFKNLKTAIKVAQAKGVILLACEKKKIPIFEFTPLQVKMTITGYGRADKKQVQKMIRIMLDLKEIPRPDDAADALGIAICCAKTLDKGF